MPLMNSDYRERIQQYANYLRGLIDQGQPINMYPDEWFMRRSIYQYMIEQIESGESLGKPDTAARDALAFAIDIVGTIKQGIKFAKEHAKVTH